MIVLNRFRQPSAGDGPALADTTESGALRARLEEALAVLSRQRGFVEGHLGRNVDDPSLWLLQTRWTGPGAYRRALSAYEVKLHAWETLGQALDEPSAYELVLPGEPTNDPRPRETGAAGG